VRIKRTADGKEFEGPDGPVPPGFEMVTTAKAPSVLGIPGARYLQPGEQAQNFPSPLQAIGSNIKKNWPDIAGDIAAMSIGGGPIAGPLKRILTQGIVTGAGRGLQGENPLEAGAKKAGSQAIGEVGLGLPMAGAQSLFRQKYINETMQKLGSYLKDNVPAFASFPATLRGVQQMFYSNRGNKKLHEMFDESLQAVVDRGKATDLPIPRKVAVALGIPEKGVVQAPPAPMGAGPVPEDMVVVNAADAAKAAVGKWKTRPSEYRAINQALDAADVGDPAIRKAYKLAMGTKTYLEKSKAWNGQQYVPENAQKALTSPASKELLRRDLGDVIDIILPENQRVMQKGSYKVPGAILGGAAGGMTAGSMMPGIGHLGGAAGGSYVGARIGGSLPKYTNVPIPSSVQAGERIGATGIGELLNQRMRSTGE